jgi:hypothetical protein
MASARPKSVTASLSDAETTGRILRGNRTRREKMAVAIKIMRPYSYKESLKITSQVNENTHPSSDTAQPLIDVHQLMDTIGTISHIIMTSVNLP